MVSVLPSSHHTLLKTSECCSIGDGVFVWLGGLDRYGTMEQLILTTTLLSTLTTSSPCFTNFSLIRTPLLDA